MDNEQRNDTLQLIDRWIKSVGVEDVWDLPKFVKKNPPIFKFDYNIAYAILALLGRTAIATPKSVVVNQRAIADLYEITPKNVDAYFKWLCKIGILQKS